MDQRISGRRGVVRSPRGILAPGSVTPVRPQCRATDRRRDAPSDLPDLGIRVRHHRGATSWHSGAQCRVSHQRCGVGAECDAAPAGVASGQRSVCVAATRRHGLRARRPRNGERYATCPTIGWIVGCARGGHTFGEWARRQPKRDVRHRETTERYRIITIARKLELSCSPAGRVRQRCTRGCASLLMAKP